MSSTCLVLRLAGPMQSWGAASRYNRRDTARQPTKGAVVGLLAAALGRKRTDSIQDLAQLTVGVRTDCPGSLLRDFHTVADLHGGKLPSAMVNAKGEQLKRSLEGGLITERIYLQDAIFVVAIAGEPDTIAALRHAVANPAFPLALGRRTCALTHPILLDNGTEQLWPGTPLQVLQQVPWQYPDWRPLYQQPAICEDGQVSLPVTIDDPAGHETELDVPTTFDPKRRSFMPRTVSRQLVRAPAPGRQSPSHDPLALLAGSA